MSCGNHCDHRHAGPCEFKYLRLDIAKVKGHENGFSAVVVSFDYFRTVMSGDMRVSCLGHCRNLGLGFPAECACAKHGGIGIFELRKKYLHLAFECRIHVFLH